MASTSKRQKKLQDELASYVRRRFDESKQHKAPDYERLKQCLRQIRGDDLACDDIDPEIKIKMNITSPIARGITGLMRDVFSNSIENPFVIKATPLADVNDEIKRLSAEMLRNKLAEFGMAGYRFTDTQAYDIGSEIRNAALTQVQEQADRAAEKMNVLVQDNLRDANWTKEFGDFLYNFTIFPTAFMKAPVIHISKVKEWDGDRVVVRDKLVRGVENISPFDIYPAPHAKSLSEAEYVIERRKISKAELVDLLSTPGFYSDGIRDVYEEYPGGYIEPYEDSPHGEEVQYETSVGDGDHDGNAQGFYDTIGFYGAIRGDVLATFGIEIPDEHRTYEAEVWLVDDIIIKAKLNPDPLGRRPFFGASFEPIPGTVWGESPVSRLESIHKICHATVKAMIVNMGYSSGIQGEVDPERVIDDNEDVRLLQPNTIRLVNHEARYGGQPAYRYYQVPNVVPQLMAALQSFQQQAYEIIGIPRVAFGSSDNLGTVGRTSGGVAMILNQASKSVKFALRIVEEQIIEPIVQSFIDYNMLINPDPSIQGDIRVYARGVSGIVEKENKEQKLEWVIQSISGWVGQVDENNKPIIPGTAIRRVLAQMFESAGVDIEGIFPDEKLERALSGVGHPSVDSLVDGHLDGRSGNAQQAIANANSMSGNGSGQPGGM